MAQAFGLSDMKGERSVDYERLARVRAELRDTGRHAIVCARPSNVRMLSGYWPVVSASIAVCTQSGSVRLIIPEGEQDLVRASWADDIRTFAPATLDSLTDVVDIVGPLLASVLRSLDLEGSASIACEAGGVPEPVSYAGMYHYGSALPNMIANALPDAEVVPDEKLLARLRGVLTPQELTVLRRACRIAGCAFEFAVDRISAGMTEVAAAGLLRSRFSNVEIESSQRADGFAWCMSGAHSAGAYAAFQLSRPTPIAAGDLVLMHGNSYVDGLWTDVTRTYGIADLTSRQRHMYGAVFEARQASLDAVRVGATGADVDDAARRVLERRGFGECYRHATGHGVGFAAIDHNARPRLHPASSDVLENGMVFNIEPGIYIDGYGGMRHCDVVALVDGRADVLTPFQPEPIVVGPS